MTEPVQPAVEPAEPTIPKSEVERLLASRGEKVSQTIGQQIADKLGCTVDEAAELLKAQREQADARKDEVQKERDAAVKAKADAEKVKAAAASEIHVSRVERALIRAGLDEKKLSRATGMVNAQVGASLDDITADVDALRKELPELFGVGVKAGSFDPQSRSQPGQPSTSAYERGAQRAMQMHGRRDNGTRS